MLAPTPRKGWTPDVTVPRWGNPAVTLSSGSVSPASFPPSLCSRLIRPLSVPLSGSLSLSLPCSVSFAPAFALWHVTCSQYLIPPFLWPLYLQTFISTTGTARIHPQIPAPLCECISCLFWWGWRVYFGGGLPELRTKGRGWGRRTSQRPRKPLLPDTHFSHSRKGAGKGRVGGRWK